MKLIEIFESQIETIDKLKGEGTLYYQILNIYKKIELKSNNFDNSKNTNLILQKSSAFKS